MTTRMSKVAEDYSLEAQLRRGFEIIEKAVDERLKTALVDVSTWKDLANAKQAQLQTLTTDLGKAQDAMAVMEKRLQLLEAENKALRTSKTSLQTKYNSLKRTSIQLEKFRSSIIQMVEHAPQNFVEDPCMSMLMESMPFRDKRSLSYTNTETDLSSGSLNERPGSTNPKQGAGGGTHGGNANPISNSNAGIPHLGGGGGPSMGGSHHVVGSSNTVGGTNYSTSSINASMNIGGHAGGGGLLRVPSTSRNSIPSTSNRILRKPASDRLSSKRTSTFSSMSVGTKDDGDYSNQHDGGDNYSSSNAYGEKMPSSGKQLSSTAADAQLLYGKIRESVAPSEFAKFATIINNFNSQKIGVTETLSKVEEIVTDKLLFDQMRSLVFRAMEESSSETKFAR